MKRHLMAAALAALLSACATEPTPLATAVRAPAERVFALPTPKSTAPARVTVVRDTGSGAMDSDVIVWIDGIKAAVLRPGEIASFQVEPGDRQVTADHTWNELKVMKPIVLDNRAEPGQHLVYRVGFENQGGTMRLVMNRDLLAAGR